MNDDPRAALFELERHVIDAFARARSLIATQDEEIGKLRQEALQRNEEFLSEKQVAAIFQVSEATIAKERTDGRAVPTCYLMSVPRYARSQLAEIYSARRKWVRKLKKVA